MVKGTARADTWLLSVHRTSQQMAGYLLVGCSGRGTALVSCAGTFLLPHSSFFCRISAADFLNDLIRGWCFRKCWRSSGVCVFNNHGVCIGAASWKLHSMEAATGNISGYKALPVLTQFQIGGTYTELPIPPPGLLELSAALVSKRALVSAQTGCLFQPPSCRASGGAAALPKSMEKDS